MVNEEAHRRMAQDIQENSDLYDALAGTHLSSMSVDVDESALTTVVRYVLTPNEDGGLTREYITCPYCGRVDVDSPEIHEHHDETPQGILLTDGSVTVCSTETCSYVEHDNTQIRETVTSSEPPSVGPHRDDSRERYPHSEDVVLVGGHGHL